MARGVGQLQARRGGGQLTILTATSGDTGAAVAHAFYNVPGVEVWVLYPAGRISDLQERLFCGLGGNVHTFRVAGSFDDCQAMVKACFRDPQLTADHGLTSANSINISRILAQCLYYFEGVARVRERTGVTPTIVVPSGNFGNLTAGLFARRMGLPAHSFVAATNRNDIVPAFLQGGAYTPRIAVPTPSNAMDVGDPSNWERIVAFYGDDESTIRQAIRSGRASDEQTFAAMRRLYEAYGYVADPHTAVGAHVMDEVLSEGEVGLLLSTAHPAKFQRAVEEALGIDVPLPPALAAVEDGEVLSKELAAEPGALVEALRGSV